MTRDSFIQQVNDWGARQIPFFVLIDFACENFHLQRLSDINPQELLYAFPGQQNSSGTADDKAKETAFTKHPQSFASYQKSFNTVFEGLQKGYSYLTNLTCETPIETPLSLQDIFHRSQAPYRLCFQDQFVVFSPETFIKIHDQHIYSYPMKGTIDARIAGAADLILQNKKEQAEHATIVDLIRNDLSQVATKVQVSRYRYLDKIKTHQGELLQVSSEIKGLLPEDYRSQLGSILLQLLPAGSISGAPKPATLDLIRQAETYDRGFYTGIMGIFDGKHFDSAVLIRFIEQREGRLYFKSGGGITAQSQARDEYEEMVQKVYLPFA